MKHDQVTTITQGTAALYALGALSQHEARAFDSHIREGCPICESELKQFDKVVGAIGAAAEPVPPPAYVRDLLSVRIEKEPSESPASSGSVLPFPEQPGLAAQRVEGRSSASALLPWAVAASLLIALTFGLTALRSERESLRAATEREKAAASESQRENTELQEQLAAQSERSNELAQINSVLSSTQWRIIPLRGQEPAPASSAKVYWDVRGKRWVVTADLPPPPEGKTYQLWFVTPESKISAGLIAPDKTGHAFTVVQFPTEAGQLDAAAITLEPNGGSQQPTMPIYLLGKAS